MSKEKEGRFGITTAEDLLAAISDELRLRGIPHGVVTRLMEGRSADVGKLVVDAMMGDFQRCYPGLLEDLQKGVVKLMRAWISYDQPKFGELELRFRSVPKDLLLHRIGYLRPIECCKEVSLKDRSEGFVYVHMDCPATDDEVFVEIDRRGLRPALYEELLGFIRVHEKEVQKYPIAALGSVARSYDSTGDRDYFAYVRGDARGRERPELCLTVANISTRNPTKWPGHFRFLAVPR